MRPKWWGMAGLVLLLGCNQALPTESLLKAKPAKKPAPRCPQENGICSDPNQLWSVTLEVDLQNADTVAIELGRLSEPLGAETRVEPGGYRMVRLTVAWPYWLTAFRAGRDSSVVSQVACQYRHPWAPPPGPAFVQWNGTRLSCGGVLQGLGGGS